MLQKTLNKTVRTRDKISEIKILKQEVGLLRSCLISMLGEDNEGKYNPKFVQEMLKATKENPTNSFGNGKSFLEELNRI
ncbi:hypothetical protein ACFL23_00660 [Patescibacteria group bacterium]